MAGGPTTPDLIAAASRTGAFAFVAGAYRSATELADEVRDLSARLSAPFGVNLFVPGRPSSDPQAIARYVAELESDGNHLGVEVGRPQWDDDDWEAKIEVLTEFAPAVASFTFGCPSKSVIDKLQRRGTLVMITVTNLEEADAAVGVGADLLCAQGIEAGAHRAAFDDTAPDGQLTTMELLQAIVPRGHLPVVAAGGIATPTDVRAALASGAIAVQAGTAFLASPEAGTHATHRASLTDSRYTSTALTRAFTGRRARGLVNGFMQRHATAPSAFPEIHHATRPLRAEALRRGDTEHVNLWAGTGYRDARANPAADIIEWLVSELDA